MKKRKWTKCFRILSHSLDLERMKGIEPSYQAWEARILPLNYTRMIGTYIFYQQILYL